MTKISETDLILNKDGSIYHLNLHPQDIADTVITVGDPDRVEEVSKYFDSVELKKGKREFITHTGRIGNKRITVLSTGIGTDNIDIVFNELDALVNIDLETRTVNQSLRRLNLIRIGTSGALQADIPVDSLLVSAAAIGLDVLMHYYNFEQTDEEKHVQQAFQDSLGSEEMHPYFVLGSTELIDALASDLQQGTTITAPGFYAPQGRQVRLKNTLPELMQQLQNFKYSDWRITNLEMETAGIYGMASSLGHHAISFNVILANRVTQQFSKDPSGVMERSIEMILGRISQS